MPTMLSSMPELELSSLVGHIESNRVYAGLSQDEKKAALKKLAKRGLFPAAVAHLPEDAQWAGSARAVIHLKADKRYAHLSLSKTDATLDRLSALPILLIEANDEVGRRESMNSRTLWAMHIAIAFLMALLTFVSHETAAAIAGIPPILYMLYAFSSAHNNL